MKDTVKKPTHTPKSKNAEHQNICNDHGVKYAKCGHTPGPWIVRTSVTGHGRYSAIKAAGVLAPIADVIQSDEDARLIAAAPDLLEAAKRFIAVGMSGVSLNDWDALRAAVKKAESR